MTTLFFEDPFYGNFEPLSISHPVYTLLCGTSKIFEKWLDFIEPDDYGFLSRPYLADILNLETDKKVNEIPEKDFLIINGRFLPTSKIIAQINKLETNEALIRDDFLVAYRGNADIDGKIREALQNIYTADGHEKLKAASKTKNVESGYLDYTWNLVEINGRLISEEFARFKNRSKSVDLKYEDNTIINQNDVFIGESVQIAPSAVIDASGGPVIIKDETIIEPFSYIQGPCYIGPDCRIAGAKIHAGSSFGPVCRVGGEVEESIMLGYCNKYHEGFLGHAYLGEWINLGALTTNSDLKNNYKEISVELGGGNVNTGRIKIGCFIGDHTKTGIGTMLNTGINIGYSCNLYGAGLFAEKRVSSFSWGVPGDLQKYKLEKAIETAGISMGRRGIEFSSIHKRLFEDIYRSN
jgi:UDP-N-acetylglucosamine diphosphorylase/glucosamine-1-phosphate N-acetyltransferase